jgi:hypothetical protein
MRRHSVGQKNAQTYPVVHAKTEKRELAHKPGVANFPNPIKNLKPSVAVSRKTSACTIGDNVAHAFPPTGLRMDAKNRIGPDRLTVTTSARADDLNR